MSERVAVVGNREGADLDRVIEFMQALWASQPDTIVISGGAQGVDFMAESEWFRLGGHVRSYRPAPFEDGFGIELWEYGGDAYAYCLPPAQQRVQLADFRSAALYRDTMIAEDCDRLVAFFRPGGERFSGAAFTRQWAEAVGADVYSFCRESA